jgi:hypothetical protein
MKPSKRPRSVTIVAWLYIVTGTGGSITHLIEFLRSHAFHLDFIEAELVELIAIVCGIFMLRGQNWARWLALAWIGFHVILSGFSSLHEFFVHAVFFIAIAKCLFGDDPANYFRGDALQPDMG